MIARFAGYNFFHNMVSKVCKTYSEHIAGHGHGPLTSCVTHIYYIKRRAFRNSVNPDSNQCIVLRTHKETLRIQYHQARAFTAALKKITWA
jgi:hypothetical protein